MIRILYYWDGRWFSTGHVSTYHASDGQIFDRIRADLKRNMEWWDGANEHLTWSILYDDMQAPEYFNITKEELYK